MQTIYHRNKRKLTRPTFVSVRRLLREYDHGLPYDYVQHGTRWQREFSERSDRTRSLTWLGTHGKAVYRVNVIPKP